jgi:hypothetical protein
MLPMLLFVSLCAGRCDRCFDLFSVNCVFFTVMSIVAAIVVALMLPAPNQPIITACQMKDYRKIHTLIEEQLAAIETEMQKQPDKWQGRTKAHVDDIDFGVRNKS